MLYSWQTESWQSLIANWQQLPHAILFSGKQNIGKTAFARYFAQTLLCENNTTQHQPCHHCTSCHLFEQQSHPDFYQLTPEIPDGEAVGRKLLQIKIDAVREMIEHIHLTAVRGGRRVVLIHPAESMNIQAANGLLKILEEPPANVIFLLVSHERDRLLPTIKSRCRTITLTPPTPAQSLQYLQQNQIENAETLLAFHSNAPLFEHQPEQDAMRETLLQLLANPRLLAILDYAADFDKQKWTLTIFLNWLQKWLTDLSLAQQQLPPLYYPHHQNALIAVAQKTTPTALFSLLQAINTLSPYGNHTLSVKMQIEFLLTEYLTFWQNKN